MAQEEGLKTQLGTLKGDITNFRSQAETRLKGMFSGFVPPPPPDEGVERRLGVLENSRVYIPPYKPS